MVKILHLTTAAVEFQEAGKRHDTHFVTKTKSGTVLEGLGCHNGVGSLNHVVQEVSLIELHDAAGLRGCTIAEIPVDVHNLPEVVAFLCSEEVPHVFAIAMTLHIGDDIEYRTHEGTWTEILIIPIRLVVEEGTTEAFRMGVFLGILTDDAGTITAGITKTLAEVVVKVVLEGLTHIVVHLHVRVEGRQFLALGSHTEDATNHHRTAGIHFCILTTENLREVHSHAMTNTMMLLLANVGEFTQTTTGGGDETLQFLQGFFTKGCKFALFVGTTEDTQNTGVVIFIDEPTGTVTSVMGHIEGFVALRGGCQGLLRCLIRHIVGARLENVCVDFFLGCLGRRN